MARKRENLRILFDVCKSCSIIKGRKICSFLLKNTQFELLEIQKNLMNANFILYFLKCQKT